MQTDCEVDEKTKSLPLTHLSVYGYVDDPCTSLIYHAACKENIRLRNIKKLDSDDIG